MSIFNKNACQHYVSDPRSGYFCARPKGHDGEHNKFPDDQGVRISEELRSIQERIAEVMSELDNLRLKEKEAKPRTAQAVCMGWTVNGKGCGAILPVGELTYIQTHWYTSPYGCTGGDYWNQGEGQFVCPKCGELNRLYERPQVEALKGSFKEIKDKYEK